MLNINDIGADAMIHTRDHQTTYLFDPWDYLGPKRKMLLSESWAGLFREHILPELPVHKLARFFYRRFWEANQRTVRLLGLSDPSADA